MIDSLEKLIAQLKGKRVSVFGAGELGQALKRKLQESQITVEYFWETFREASIDGVLVKRLTIDEIDDCFKEEMYVLMTIGNVEMSGFYMNLLAENGVRNVIDIFPFKTWFFL